ncbi:MAG: hypothetical protein RI897_3134 [Verrucomicrobiota bacterium]
MFSDTNIVLVPVHAGCVGPHGSTLGLWAVPVRASFSAGCGHWSAGQGGPPVLGPGR